MNILSRYIAWEIVKAALLASLFLLTLYNLFTFSDEMRSYGKGNYGLTEIATYLALTSPTVFYELMPTSALIGSLFILGAMANNRELVAMQGAGLSVLGIIRSIILAGLLLTLFSLVIGEFIAPRAQQQAQVIKSVAKEGQLPSQNRYGLWLREGNKFINVRRIENNGDLSIVIIYTLNSQRRLESTLHADHAVYSHGKQWRLLQTRQSDVSLRGIRNNYSAEQILTTSIAPDLFNFTIVPPNNLSVFELAKYINFLQQNQQKSQIYQMAFWRRIVNPFITFVMLLISAPFVIGVRRGISVGARMIIGVTIGLGFYIADQIVGHVGLVYNLNAPFIASLPCLLAFAAAISALRRHHV